MPLEAPVTSASGRVEASMQSGCPACQGKNVGRAQGMTQYGFSLMCELHHPNDLVEQAKRAEAAGFDFVTISDHFHPWLYSHGHSPFAWSVLGGVAATTERIRMMTLV